MKIKSKAQNPFLEKSHLPDHQNLDVKYARVLAPETLSEPN